MRESGFANDCDGKYASIIFFDYPLYILQIFFTLLGDSVEKESRFRAIGALARLTDRQVDGQTSNSRPHRPGIFANRPEAHHVQNLSSGIPSSSGQMMNLKVF